MTPLRTPLYDWHVAHGGRMVEFGGWEMPVQYTSIVEEHHAVRHAAGLFDISHMGRLDFGAPGSIEFINRIITSDLSSLKTWRGRYGLICRDDGGVLDDVIVYRGDGRHSGLLIVNAGNRIKIRDWLSSHSSQDHFCIYDDWDGIPPRFHENPHSDDVLLGDSTTTSAMLALQGPQSQRILEECLGIDVRWMRYFEHRPFEVRLPLERIWIARTGYTGEDGFELIMAAEHDAQLSRQVVQIWDDLLKVGQKHGLIPCGLGARDTLRLEAAMPLYGHELTEDIDPITAGLEFAVKFEKPDFLGKAALQEIAKRTDRNKRIGLILDGKRIAREGSTVMQGDQSVGTVTSGTFSPTLEKSIAMAYVTPQVSAVGTPLEVDIRGKRERAVVAPLPFYKRPKI